jgi:hypothetical protein
MSIDIRSLTTQLEGGLETKFYLPSGIDILRPWRLSISLSRDRKWLIEN